MMDSDQHTHESETPVLAGSIEAAAEINRQTVQLDRFDGHLRILRGLQASSVARYRAHVAEFFAWRANNTFNTPFAALKPVELRKEVEEYLGWCYRRGNGNTTRLAKMTAIRNYFRILVYNRELAEDPTKEIPNPPADSDELVPFTRSEVLRLFGEIDITTEKGLRDAVFLIMGAFAGFRVGAITKFNIEDVIDDGDYMYLSVAKDKSTSMTRKKRHRKVWIWKAPAHYVRALLLARIGQGAQVGDPLLVSYKKNGRPRDGNSERCMRCSKNSNCEPLKSARAKGCQRLTPDACDDILKKLVKRAGIRRKRIKIHALRATHACNLRNIRGFDTFAIMKRMGWKDLNTATRYITDREPVYRLYNDLRQYWIDFPKVWTRKASSAEGAKKGAAANV